MTTDTFDPMAAVEAMRPAVADMLAMSDKELADYIREERAADDGDAIVLGAVRKITLARNWLAQQSGEAQRELPAFDRLLVRIRAAQAHLDRGAH